MIYCENGSAEINVCNFGGFSVEVTNVREANGQMGIPYYCSSEMSSFVTVNGTTIMYGNSSVSIVSYNLPLIANNEDVYFGKCIEDGDKVFFICTTTLGSTYLVNLSSQDLDEEEAILLMERGVNSATFVQHQLYFDDDIVVYNNGSSTMLYNISCQNFITTVNHQYQLSLVVPSEGQHLCTCRKLTSDSGRTTTVTPSDSNNDNNNTGKTIGIVVGVIVAVIIIIISIAIIVPIAVLACKKVKNRYS
jgi:hypothetical protein